MLLNVLVFVLGIGSQKATVLLLIWLMCFLTKAFAASLSRHCGQGSGQNRAWLQIKCGRTTLVEIMISASES